MIWQSLSMGVPGDLAVKNPPAMQEMQVWALGQEDPLEKEMAMHSNILAWEIPWAEEPGGYSPWSHRESDTTEQLSIHTHENGIKGEGLAIWGNNSVFLGLF